MKNKLKKIITIIIVIMFSLGTLTAVKADSGWDSDYDSGGSTSSSSSSWDSDYDSSSVGDSGVTVTLDLPGVVVMLIVVAIIIFVCYRFNGRTISIGNSTATKENQFNDVDNSLVEEMLPGYNLEKLKDELFNKFVEIQIAWMEFDYDKLRKLCTDELYNSYVSQLDVLKVKQGKNIMEQFDKLAVKVYEIKKENNVITIESFVAVSFYDYVINTNTNEVTRGNKNAKITNNYKMTFVVSSGEQKIENCPSCGAPIEDGSSTTCKYCNSVIVKQSNEFVLSKKTNINN